MRRLIVFLLAGALILAPASSTTARPRPSSIMIVGHGWGHGHGMGQYGARAMAFRGYRWKTILHHYYSAVRIDTTVRTGVRVLLDRQRAVVLASHDPFRVIADRRVIARSDEGHRFMRARAGGGYTYIDRAPTASGPWSQHLRTRARTVGFVHGSSLMQVRRSSGFRWYRGSILAVRGRGMLDVIDQLDLEKYLLGVVPREMPASWPMEALKAQAVAARTYALRVARLARARGKAYDICATPSCQVYGGRARMRNGQVEIIENDRTTSAVFSTRRKVMTYDGHLILAEYSSSTGGWTTSGGFPYLRGVRDRYDEGAPNHTWKVQVSAAALEASWPSIGDLYGVRVLRRTTSFARGGRVESLRIEGSRGSVTLSGDVFRLALGLRSRWFAVAGTTTGGSVRFTGDMGYGMHDPAVAELQRRLRAGGFFPREHAITTYFGPITRRAVMRYQHAHHLPETGFVGPKTRRALNR